MSNAERQRRFIQRLKSGVTNGAAPPVTDDKRVAELERFVTDARQQIADLTQALAESLDREEALEKHLKSGARQTDRLMQPAVYRKLLAYIHPDRASDEADKQRATELFSVVSQMRDYLTRSEEEEQAKLAAERQASRMAEWQARAEAAATKRSERAKKAAETRKRNRG